MENTEFVVEIKDKGTRIDVYLNDMDNVLTRSYIKKLIKDGMIRVNGNTVKPSYSVSVGDRILINIPPPIDIEITPENIPLKIIYEDDDLIVIDKPQGMVVHPAPGNYTGTLVNALLYHCNLSGINGKKRPGIVHRIDKDTSGVLVVAKTNTAHISLAKQIKDKTVNRIYLALVRGVITEDNGVIDMPVGRHPVDRKKMTVTDKGGRNAVTKFSVLDRFDKYTYIKAVLETGRTHQIRVHMAHIGFPVIGDPVYSSGRNEFNQKSQMLHATILGFIHPTKNEYVEFESPLPEEFSDVLNRLGIN